MLCSKCGSPTRTADEVEAVVCGSCVQRMCAGVELRAEARLAHYDAATFRELRADHGWTQTVAAARIGVPVTRLQEFERGGLCPEEIADWMDDRAAMP